MEARGLFITGKPLFKKLAGLLAVFICVDAYLVGCELLTMGYPGAEESVALSIIATGVTAPFFCFEVICGLLIPFLILVVPKNREKKGLILLASILVVLGVFCKRVWILLAGFITPFVEGTLSVPGQDLAAAGMTFGQLGAGGGKLNRMDYLGVELEFVAYLLEQCATADALEQRRALAAEAAAFIDEYVLLWLPRYRADVEAKCQTEFWKGYLELLEAALRDVGTECAQLGR